MGKASKRPAVADFMRSLTYKKLLDDPGLLKHVVDHLAAAHYDLIMPPERPRDGDQYIGGDTDTWCEVTESTHKNLPLTNGHYLVRRKTEHRRMLEFFFGVKE